MPLPVSFYAAPPSPWVWPGWGSAVTTSVVRAYQPTTPPPALAGLPGPTGHFPGSFPGGPTPVPPPAIPALPDTEMHSRSFFGCHAPFCPTSREPSTTVCRRSHLCSSHGDAARCCEHFTGPFPGHDQELEGGVHAGDENQLGPVCWWRSTSANRGSRCSVREHGPRRAAAAESLWRPRGVTGSA